MIIRSLLSAILNASEKAAEVARCIRKEDLFSLLIQEKTGAEKSSRFEVDFKTLADVLIQEMIRHDLEQKFPGIGDRVFGEESNQFTNALGETIRVVINDDDEKTLDMLQRAFDGNMRVAQILLKVITANFEVDGKIPENLKDREIDVNDFGIWIDPIDSTFEYISGEYDEYKEPGISRCGLSNVTVLIGAFSWDDGLPFLGVINQPFHKRTTGEPWQGRALWGISLPDIKAHHGSLLLNPNDQSLVITSSAEVERLKKCFAASKLSITKAPGAGYKQLCIIDGYVLSYILIKNNTYRWDCCGPHAILSAMGGGVLRLSDALEAIDDLMASDPTVRKQNIQRLQLTYKVVGLERRNSKEAIERFSNKEGLFAYGSEETLFELLKVLKENEL